VQGFLAQHNMHSYCSNTHCVHLCMTDLGNWITWTRFHCRG